MENILRCGHNFLNVLSFKAVFCVNAASQWLTPGLHKVLPFPILMPSLKLTETIAQTGVAQKLASR